MMEGTFIWQCDNDVHYDADIHYDASLYASSNQGRDREGLESSRSPLTPCSKPPESYALICMTRW